MLLVTKKAVEHVAVCRHAYPRPSSLLAKPQGMTHQPHLGDQPEVLDHGTQSASRLPGSRGSALPTCVPRLDGHWQTDSQERVYTSSGEDLSDASGERGKTGV